MKRLRRLALASLALPLVLGPLAVFAIDPPRFTVSQKNTQFSEKDVTVPVGGRVRFKNDDEYLHQLYVASQIFSFDSNEQKPGETIDIQFPVAGNFKVLCAIHPKMKLDVHVH